MEQILTYTEHTKLLYDVGCDDEYRPRAILSILMTRMIVGFIGITSVCTSSSIIPTIESTTINVSSWFHLNNITYKTQITCQN